MRLIDKRSSKYSRWFVRFLDLNILKFILFSILFSIAYVQTKRLDISFLCLGFVILTFWLSNYRSSSKYFIQFIEVLDNEVVVEYWKWNTLFIEKIPVKYLFLSFKGEAKIGGSSFLAFHITAPENNYRIYQYTCGWSKDEQLAVLEELSYRIEDSKIKKAT